MDTTQFAQLHFQHLAVGCSFTVNEAVNHLPGLESPLRNVCTRIRRQQTPNLIRQDGY
jgi:hypothetical protein